MKMKKFRLGIFEAALWILSLIILIPLAAILINSVKTPAETNVLTLALPETWEFGNFSRIFRETNVVRSFFNSTLVTVASIVLSVFLGTIAGYVLSRNMDFWNKKIYAFFMAGMIIPLQMIALVQVLQKIRLLDSYLGLILVYAAMFIPQSVFMVSGFVNTVPKDMDEAGIVDGCGPWQLFAQIVLPLLKPILVTLFITQFVFVWNDFQMPLYLIKSSENWTIVLGVYNFMGQFNSEWNMVCAYILVCTIPAVAVYILGQRYIIDGMAAGAVKG
ncbi:MAG: carbohydrate ABC transporter permease [Lachnospiraceae bacterium]|nr:carbohydrate ABC transporter permease [Lachnospiraceae bacterium]